MTQHHSVVQLSQLGLQQLTHLLTLSLHLEMVKTSSASFVHQQEGHIVCLECPYQDDGAMG